MEQSNTAGSAAPLERAVTRAIRLKQFAKLLNRQASIPSDTAHGVGVDGIVARDGDDTLTVAHNDVSALTHDAKSGLLEYRTASR